MFGGKLCLTSQSFKFYLLVMTSWRAVMQMQLTVLHILICVSDACLSFFLHTF